MRALYFQTNFEILHMQFARSRAFQGMFEAFDASEVRCRSAVGCARASSSTLPSAALQHKDETYKINVLYAGIFETSLW